jgi:hypothetical protein
VSFTSCSKDEEAPEWSFLYGEWMPAGEYEEVFYGELSYSAWCPSSIRLVFDRTGNMTFYQPEDDSDEFPWINGTYGFKVQKNDDGELYLKYLEDMTHQSNDGYYRVEFDDNQARIWYVAEEDALYYNFKGTFYSQNGYWCPDRYYIFKRVNEANKRLPIEDRDKNVEIKSVNELCSHFSNGWVKRTIEEYGESAAYKEGVDYSRVYRIHEFKLNNKVYYHMYYPPHLSSQTNRYLSYDGQEDFDVTSDMYSFVWKSTDWKLVYIFPRNY